LNDESRIALHSKKSGASIDVNDYSQWMSVIPIRRINASVVNILPREIRDRKLTRFVARYGLIALGFLIAILISVSVVKEMSIRSLEKSVSEHKLIAGDAGADPVLDILSNFEAKASSLNEYASITEANRSFPMKPALVALSRNVRENIRLNRLDLIADDQMGLKVLVFGEVTGQPERQEVEFFAFITSLEKHPYVRSMDLRSKDMQLKSDVTTLQFSFELTVGQ
jgi:hypothetical protein